MNVSEIIGFDKSSIKMCVSTTCGFIRERFFGALVWVERRCVSSTHTLAADVRNVKEGHMASAQVRELGERERGYNYVCRKYRGPFR